MNAAELFYGSEECFMKNRNFWLFCLCSAFDLDLSQDIHHFGNINLIRAARGTGFTGSANPDGSGRQSFLLLEQQD
jgi:hypothetical protein